MCILKSDVLHSTYYRIKNDFMIALNGIQWEEIIISTLHKLITLMLLLLVYFALKKGAFILLKIRLAIKISPNVTIKAE